MEAKLNYGPKFTWVEASLLFDSLYTDMLEGVKAKYTLVKCLNLNKDMCDLFKFVSKSLIKIYGFFLWTAYFLDSGNRRVQQIPVD